MNTEFYASDPNLGRIQATAGYAGIGDLNVAGTRIWLVSLLVSEYGGRPPATRRRTGRGSAKTTVWTCDFSYAYVKINADYRS